MATRDIMQERIRLYIETAGDKELSALAAQLQKVGQGADASAEQAQGLIAELQKLASTSNNIRQYTALKAAIADTGDQLHKAKDRLVALRGEFDYAEQPTKKLERALARAGKEVETLTKQQNRQQAELGRTTNALRAAGVDTNKLGDAYTKLQGQFGSFATRAGTAVAAMDATAKKGKAAAGSVTQLGHSAETSAKSLAAIAARLTLVSGAATGAIQGLAALTGATLFTGAIRSASTLEEALSQVQAVSGATREEMEQLKEAAERGGAATTFSTLEAAQGLGELARATGSAQAAIAALPATLNLAQAAGIGVAEAAQFITTTLTQFGLGAEQASRVSDVLSKEVNATTDSMGQLGNALTYAAPLASQLGLDLEETAAIIGTLADEGFRGERAGTALRNVFQAMEDPTSAFAKALSALGIQTNDFATVISELAKRGEEGKKALRSLDAAATPAILSLVKKGGGAIESLTATLRDATGEAERTAKGMGDNLAGAAEAIKDSFDRTRRSLVEPLLEPLKNDLFALSKELEEFAQSPEFEEIKVALRELFVEGASAARDLVNNIDFAKLAQDIKSFVGEASGTIKDLHDNLSEVVLAIQLVGHTFQLIFNVVQAAVLGLAALVTKLGGALLDLAETIQAPYRAALEFIGVLDEGQGSLSEFAGGINAVADEFRTRFAKNVLEAGDAARALAEAGKEAGEQAADGVEKVATASDHAARASESLSAAAERTAPGLEKMGDAAKSAGDKAAEGAEKVKTAEELLADAFQGLGLTAQNDLSKAAEVAKRHFETIQNAFRGGKARIEDQGRAFAAYAQALRASVADSDAATKEQVEGQLRVQEAVYGVTQSLSQMGDVGRDTGSQVAQGARQAADSLDEIGNAGDTAAGAIADNNSAAGDMEKRWKEASKEGAQFALSLYSVSDAAIAAYQATNRYAGSRMWADMVNEVTHAVNQQGDQVRKLVQDMEAANAQFDEMSQLKAELSQRFNLLGDNEISQLAQAYKATADNQKRAADEARRNREETEAQADAARLAALEQRQQSVGSGGAEEAPLVVELRAPKEPEGGRQYSAQEEAELDRLAARLAPRIIQRIERSRNFSVRRKTR